jgi:hypothetical protein
MSTMRAAAGEVSAEYEQVSVFATAPCNHVQIPSKAPETVIAATEDVVRRSS